MPIPRPSWTCAGLVGEIFFLLWLPGVTAVIRRGDEILLVQRSLSTMSWTPVTGIVDLGGSRCCAVREAMEETGVETRRTGWR